MPTSPACPFHLATTFAPASGAGPATYQLVLGNRSDAPVADFRLCVSGPARIAPAGSIGKGTLAGHLSNHAELAPPAGFVLEPGREWSVTVRGPGYPLRHWTDGTRAAYLVLADGATARVSVAPAKLAGDDAEPKRGAELPAVPEAAPEPLSIVPWPRSVDTGGRLAAPEGLALHAADTQASAAIETFAELTESLFPAEGIARPEAEGGFPVAVSTADGFGPEAYAIRFSPAEAALSASTRTGLLYGLVTLGQILRGARRHPGTFLFPAGGEIRDEPHLGWRGCHLDAARQFYGAAEIERFLKILAWNKLNRFHWHLSDDEAWRVEIDAYPELTRIGAWRGHGLPIPPLLGSGPEASGGYYTKAAIRRIVALAARLGIEVVPEIDVPGHCHAMLQSLPALRDPDESGSYFSVQAFPNNCLNPAREETYRVLETIFDELIELFPSKTIHVGADEVPLGAWSGSPQALAWLRKNHGAAAAEAHARRSNIVTNTHGADEIEGSGAALLQAHFLKRVQAFLASRGCVTGGWEEAAHGNAVDRQKVYLNGWRNVEVSAALAGQGYDMVVCPGQVYYLDMANGPDWSEPGAAWAGWSSPEKLYGFDPVEGWTDAEKKHFLGVQCCIWSEPMSDRAVFDRLVFPRLSALAETAWTRPDAKSWERFRANAGLMPVLYGLR